MIANVHFADDECRATPFDFAITLPDCSQHFDSSLLEIGQIIRVVDMALRIGFLISHSESKFESVHAQTSSTRLRPLFASMALFHERTGELFSSDDAIGVGIGFLGASRHVLPLFRGQRPVLVGVVFRNLVSGIF